MSKQGVVAIIPARGGSKRLPRKNLAPFFGKPLIQYSIEACQASKEITGDVYVSTEDSETAEVARSLGAKVIERPAYLAGDDVWTVDVVRQAVSELERQGAQFDAIARIYPSPQVTAGKVDEAARLLREKNLWEVFSVNKEGIEDAVIHVLLKKCLTQKELSVYKGVVQTDYVDVHRQADLDRLERERIEEIERRSHAYLQGLERQLRHSSMYQELLYLAGRSKKLWAWQMKMPLYDRWRAIVGGSDEFRSLLYSWNGFNRASQLRVLDVGCGFGMYWPVLREFGVRKFVGVDLFDMRRRETYYEAAKRYVEKFCPDCETQLIMDDMRNLGEHDLLFDSFDVVLAVATASTKLKSTAIPRDVFDEFVDRFGGKNCIPVYVENV